MKKKKNAKDRRKATQIHWEKSTDREKGKTCGAETHCDEDDETFDLANEIIMQFEEDKIDKRMQISISSELILGEFVES